MRCVLLVIMLFTSTCTLLADERKPLNMIGVQTWCKLLERSSKGEKLSPAESTILATTGAYIEGLMDGLDVSAAFNSQLPFKLPEGFNNLELAGFLSRYLDKHPEELTEYASVVIPFALKTIYPNK